jgi:hypothetical protein
MNIAYKGLTEKTQAAAYQAMGMVMEQIEVRIASFTMKPYDDRDVWIP